MGDDLPAPLLGEALPDGSPILLGYLLVIQGCPIQEHAKRVFAPILQVFEEALSRNDLVLWKLVDEAV
ncbi:MAG: hypothetical protein QOJ16_2692 [Acidobacteriota bacterium]|nr:hypothetical protein [Acidobacteriota bacterium]